MLPILTRSAGIGTEVQSLSVDTPAVTFLAAMITPAILIVACASLISSCLMRLGRVIDRVRVLAQLAEDIRLGKCTEHPTERRREIGVEFLFYQRRGKLIMIALGLQYGTVGFFVATSIGVAVDLLLGGLMPFIPVLFSILGISLLLLSSLILLYENRLAFQSMQREIQFVHILEQAIFEAPAVWSQDQEEKRP